MEKAVINKKKKLELRFHLKKKSIVEISLFNLTLSDHPPKP